MKRKKRSYTLDLSPHLVREPCALLFTSPDRDMCIIKSGPHHCIWPFRHDYI